MIRLLRRLFVADGTDDVDTFLFRVTRDFDVRKEDVRKVTRTDNCRQSPKYFIHNSNSLTLYRVCSAFYTRRLKDVS